MSAHWFPKRSARSWMSASPATERQALVLKDRRWTFAELARNIDAVARGLVALGVAPGEKVSLWMMNRPEWIAAALAVMRIGVVLVPINTRFRTEDAAYVLGQSDSSTLVIAARSGPIDYLGMVRTLLPTLGSDAEAVSDPKLPALQRVIVLGDGPTPGTITWPSLLAAGTRVPDDALRSRTAASRCTPTSWCATSWSARSVWG